MKTGEKHTKRTNNIYNKNGLKGQEITPQSQIKLESETTIKVEENDVVLLETTESNEVREVKNDIDELSYILGI